jgi:Metallo-peptidase family M12
MKIVTYATNQPHLGDVRYIDWTPLGSIFNTTGDFAITLPDENGGQPISFGVAGFDFTSETDYAIYGRSAQGDIALYTTQQGTGGSITLVNSVYAMYPLGGTKGVLIKKNLLAAESIACAMDIEDDDPPYEACEGDCGKGILDVLVMVTPAAKTYLVDTYGILWQWFLYTETQSMNGAFVNSLILNKWVRFQTIDYTPPFALSNEIEDDMGLLKNNPNTGMTLLNSGAVVGLLLTNQDYVSTNGIIGWASTLDPTGNDDKFCIAEVPFLVGPTSFLIAHEIAHLMGCRHTDDLSTLNCPHGKDLNLVNKVTIMNPFFTHRTIQHFSNPAVYYGGQSTGTPGWQDNAVQIRSDGLCVLADDNSPVWFSVDYDHAPLEIYSECPLMASASISPGQFITLSGGLLTCTGPYTYQWSWSTNNTTFTNVGTNSPNLLLPIPPACPVFQLRVTVTSANGCSARYTKGFVCNNGPCIRDNEQLHEEELLAEGSVLIPNPAFDRIQINLESSSSNPEVLAINPNGQIVSRLPVIAFEKGILTCDVSSLPSGFWFVEVEGKAFKMAIAR